MRQCISGLTSDLVRDGAASDLRRLFLVLLDKAIKYTDKEATNMTLAVEDAVVSITGSNTGIEIEPSALPHIFDIRINSSRPMSG